MADQITIHTSTDWNLIRQAQLKVVVDPMVFRTADVCLRGLKGIEKSPGKKQLEQMWSAISSTQSI